MPAKTTEIEKKIGTAHEMRRAWRTALNSGKYAQGASYLNSLDKKGNEYHCCFGVACKVHPGQLGVVSDRIITNTDEAAVYRKFTLSDGSQADVVFNPAMLSVYGLSLSQQNILTSLNDNHVEFSVIARAIAFFPYYIDGEYYDD